MLTASLAQQAGAASRLWLCATLCALPVGVGRNPDTGLPYLPGTGQVRYGYHPHFRDEATEAQTHDVSCLGLHSRGEESDTDQGVGIQGRKV